MLGRLVDQGNTVLVIEHNLDVIKTADWIVDMGPEGGNRGGLVVAEGTPEDVAANPDSHTGRFLKPLLDGQTRVPTGARTAQHPDSRHEAGDPKAAAGRPSKPTRKTAAKKPATKKSAPTDGHSRRRRHAHADAPRLTTRTERPLPRRTGR